MSSFCRNTAEVRYTLKAKRQYVVGMVSFWTTSFVICFLLEMSQGFMLSRQLDLTRPCCTTPLSSSPSNESFRSNDQTLSTSSPSFWSCERTAEEIVQFLTNAMTSVEPTLTPRVQIASSEPPLVILHDFMSLEDSQAILKATQQQEMQRSTMGASQEQSGGRTSTTAWLTDSLCPGPLRRCAEKTSRIMELPPSHLENLQVVRYLPNQQFTMHTDHLDSFNDLTCRGRLATCLIYLKSPLRGGETSFPEFGVKIPPVSGSAVFFFNTKERPGMDGYDPEMFLNVDPKMRHAGLPVLEGEKWICNRWIHPIEYGAGVRGTE